MPPDGLRQTRMIVYDLYFPDLLLLRDRVPDNMSAGTRSYPDNKQKSFLPPANNQR